MDTVLQLYPEEPVAVLLDTMYAMPSQVAVGAAGRGLPLLLGLAHAVVKARLVLDRPLSRDIVAEEVLYTPSS